MSQPSPQFAANTVPSSGGQLGNPHPAWANFYKGTHGQSSSIGGINPGQSNPAPTQNVPLQPGQFGYVPHGLPGSGGAGPLINPAAPQGQNWGQPSWWPTRNLQDPGQTPDPWAQQAAQLGAILAGGR